MIEPSTIHHQRRWYYAIWCILLAVSCAAWLLWVIPKSRGEGVLNIKFLVKGAPTGLTAQAWLGKTSMPLPQVEAFGSPVQPDGDGKMSIPPLMIQIARRRWVRQFHPRTTNLVVLCVSAPGGERRYIHLDLMRDLYSGYLRENRPLGYEFQIDWDGITGADGSPTRIF